MNPEMTSTPAPSVPPPAPSTTIPDATVAPVAPTPIPAPAPPSDLPPVAAAPQAPVKATKVELHPIEISIRRAEIKEEIAEAQAGVAKAKADVVAAKTDADIASAQTVLAAKQEDLSEAQGELTKFNEDNYAPIAIQPPISVQLMVGPTPTAGVPGAVLQHLTRPQDKTTSVKWHDTVIDILGRLSVPTDGSMVMLMPGTTIPFAMHDQPYSDLTANAVVAVVPNQPGQVAVLVAPPAN